jgi:hypothetical protein
MRIQLIVKCDVNVNPHPLETAVQPAIESGADSLMGLPAEAC